MYDKVVTSTVRTSGGITSEFLVTISLYQVSILNPYRFAVLMMDELTKLDQEKVPYYMLL